MDKKKIVTALEKVLETKGKRKFTQTVEAIFNFRSIDMTKPENRINLDVILPKGRGKNVPVVVFADTGLALEAKKAGADHIYDKAGIETLKANKKELKKIASKAEFVAAPQLMVEVGKNLGQVLGGRGKLPRPIVGSAENAIKQAKSRVRIMTRGKNLPTVFCAIGTEQMSIDDLVENFEVAYEKVKDKVGESAIASTYVKLTMSPTVKVQQ